ncbi:MAG: hypothetical protein KC636_32405 [Myxococcales bacterium]|nr:hypothetical protein [Myxococcales bacterium]
MSSSRQEIDALHDALRQQVTEAFSAAIAVSEGAGQSPAWLKLCARYDVRPLDDEVRDETRAALQPLRGAAVLEFQQVIRAIVRSIRAPLRRVNLFDAPTATEHAHEALLQLLRRTEGELVTAYRNAVLPRATGMFANVFASRQGPSGAKAAAITCQQCGAPRLSVHDLRCAYCGQQLMGERT